jgi:hypothetical protein
MKEENRQRGATNLEDFGCKLFKVSKLLEFKLIGKLLFKIGVDTLCVTATILDPGKIKS